VETCVVSTPHTLTPKQRKAKQRELDKAYAAQSKLSCFTIGNLRTAKHKKQLQRVRFQDTVDPDFDPIGNTQRHYREDRDDETPHDRPTRLRDDLPDGPANDARHGTETGWSPGHCEDSNCFLPAGHEGPHDFQRPEHRFRDLHRRNYAEQIRKLYPECEHEECAFHADHYGDCESKSDAKRLPSSFVAAVHDADSVLDFDPMESSFNVIIDDVTHEIARVDASDMADIPCPKQYKDTQTSPLKRTLA
jgi:hypothetical protein